MDGESFMVDISEIARMLRIGRRHAYDLVKLSNFPIPRPLGPRTQRWVRAEVESWAVARPAGVVREPEQLALSRRK